MEELKKELKEHWEEARSGGGEERIKKQHDKGKMTARERIEYLVDEGSFREMNPFTEHRCTDFGMEKKKPLGDGVVTGAAKIGGRLVYLMAQDFTVMGGSLGEMHAEKIVAVMDKAFENRVPFIQINDSGGARIQEGIRSLNGYGKIFKRNTFASGVIPQITCIMGPCAGGAVYSPAITDYIFMVENQSNMFLTGPKVIKEVTGEEVSVEELGGAKTHAQVTGTADRFFDDDRQCLDEVKRLLRYLPDSSEEFPPFEKVEDPVDRQTSEIEEVVPSDPRMAFDMREVIKPVLDGRQFMEFKPGFAANCVIGFGRLGGYPVGIVGNQPKTLAGCLDIDSADKIARFVRHCDSFNIPVINFVDVPGFLPGVGQEHNGVIRHGAKMLFAYSEASVPKISLIVRKAYGGAFVAMCSRDMGYDSVIAYPTAEIAVMGAQGAVNVIHGREINNAEDPEEKRQEKIDEFKEKFAKPYNAARAGLLDSVIEPAETRKYLVETLEMTISKRQSRPPKKHGNIPL
jgi:acetyl-CoA carboxylase carboxyltransferase component